MVLLHGFTSCWRAWEPVLPHLEAAHSVFAPTLAGHFGADDFPDGAASVVAMSDAIERQMDAQGIEKAHLVGNSQGGWLALELAARGRALSVVCLCPAGGWKPGSRDERAVIRSFRRAKLALRLSRPWFETIARRPRMRAIAYGEMVARPSRLSPALALATLEAAAGCRVVDELLDSLTSGETLFADLGPIECPVTIATAQKDRLLKRSSYFTRFRQMVPAAEWVVMDGVGHLPMSDDPEGVARLILGRASA